MADETEFLELEEDYHFDSLLTLVDEKTQERIQDELKMAIEELDVTAMDSLSDITDKKG